MEGSFPMISGDSACSYSKNSQFQKQASDPLKEVIQEAILQKHDTQTHLSISTTLAIADFGCSIGPNTFFNMQTLIQALQNKCSSSTSNNIEFHVFFNDHVDNDFNALFASLPPHRNYHAAGVPGSFHGRLFPLASISLAHSSYALHWLSRVPQGVTDSKSTAWNVGRIHYIGARREVVDAYAGQYEKDMGGFMSARGEEIVKGGLMFLVIPILPDGVSPSQHPGGVFYDCYASSLMDLAEEGIVDKTEIDKFNLPIYFPTVGEITKVIEKNGCFHIERKEVSHPKAEFAMQGMIKHMRAVFETTFTKHFGKSVVDKMFAKTSAKTEEVSTLLEGVVHNFAQLFLVLKRK